MKFSLRSRLCRAASILEIIIGSCVLVACVVCGVGIVISTDLHALFTSTMYFQAMLNNACYIIIGVEFIKMLANHTIDSVVDVMMLAVARQMIVEHTTPIENLIAVAAVGILFVVRKYLYVSKIDKCQREDESAVSPLKSKTAVDNAAAHPKNPSA